jgi:hypothetical protein
MIKGQVHSKFKVFISEAGMPYGDAMHKIATEVEKFSCTGTTAIKSVGVEYLESSKQLVLSLGYRDGETGYPVKLTTVLLGSLDLDPEEIEEMMSKTADTVENVICHEFFVTGDGQFVMVLLSHG